MSAPSRLEVALDGRGYQIVVGEGLLDDLGAQVPLPLHARRALVITQGPLVAQDGSIKVADGELPDDMMLLSMDFYVEGVEGSLP